MHSSVKGGAVVAGVLLIVCGVAAIMLSVDHRAEQQHGHIDYRAEQQHGHIESSSALVAASSFVCGTGVKVCGVLSLSSGLGEFPMGVHGLWPQNGFFGTSQCIAPVNPANPKKVFNCFAGAFPSKNRIIGFEKHEWEE